MIKVIALSGSLRKDSVNSRLLKMLQHLSPKDINVEIFGKLADIPLFNPDNANQPNQAVIELRDSIKNANLVVIASPEYAHGVTGVLKNMLDWLVGSGEFTDKPTALPMVTARSTYSPVILKEIISVMGGNVLDELSPVIELPFAETDLSVLYNNELIVNDIKQFIEQIYTHL